MDVRDRCFEKGRTVAVWKEGALEISSDFEGPVCSSQMLDGALRKKEKQSDVGVGVILGGFAQAGDGNFTSGGVGSWADDESFVPKRVNAAGWFQTGTTFCFFINYVFAGFDICAGADLCVS